MADFGHSINDIAATLGRLSEVAAGRGCQVELSQAELLERWQVVSTAAASGAIDAPALDSLRLIFNYIEVVIISCGAPDSFDVYEASFEALTKMGFVLPDLECRHLLMQLLEHVNEVYDVLLSCVETYEWVQPGATGLLRLWMLEVIFACSGADNISGRDLMALTDNDVSGAISLIAFIIRCEHAPYEMQAAAGRCLVELTTADCVFLGQVEGHDTNTEQIQKLTTMLNNHVNGLIKGLIQFEVVEAFGRCICQHQMSHSHTDVIVKHFLTTIHNSLLYCSQNQQKLRQHLATQSTIVQDIMIPYVHNILPALYDNPSCGNSNIEFQNLKSVMQTFVVVTFNIKVFRPQLRDSDMILRICDVPNILTYVSMLELLIKLSINVDYTKGQHAPQITQILKAAFDALPADSQQRLQRRIESEQGMRLPFSRSATEACELLSFALRAPLEAPEERTTRKEIRKSNWRTSKGKAKKRRRMFGMQKGFNVGPDVEDGDEADEDNSEDDMPPLLPAEKWEASLGEMDDSCVPSMAKCQLSGALMHDPVRTPDGHLFERAALEDWVSHHGSNPLTGSPLTMVECIPATDVASFIQGYQLQMLSAGTLAPAAFEPPPAPDVAPPEPKPPMPPPAPIPQQSILGDLPSLGGTTASTSNKQKDKGKVRIQSRSVVDCPEEMRCAIDGKVMTNPVRSPYGHCFEKKTLERYFATCGSICPITDKPLRLEDCQPDAEMKKTIIKFLKGQS
mmetsp:Transcript_16968/g.36531  ORF Transcript_16968/g.36531 Transcript_16968/m.36531 type:complete len:737 (+) Transcript_16968:131-2341(+)|eukprot:CAMPEP_0206489434 /NCGR_PEP_ID=MMETSP0324_2-20121206/43233_1 /ASSEMBLY_ACC=CAM_ASM_000836 /TAXON_ID=2866 /ORGANISM="Crypthecodinium cohnii, Strain Seligo" /LENGTH=736 /DNA_ID=CAMNT_0053969103 /DNA_START=57 /DNA_END=2267 /DNA_ORIENTATION=-